MTEGAKQINRTIHKSYEWLGHFCDELGIEHNPELALSYVRAVLKTLRDRLPLEEAIQLGDQLPVLMRGYYYESWKPHSNPTKLRTEESFLIAVEKHISRTDPHIELKDATRAAFDVILSHISMGEMEDVVQALNKKVRNIFQQLPLNDARLS